MLSKEQMTDYIKNNPAYGLFNTRNELLKWLEQKNYIIPTDDIFKDQKKAKN